MITVTPAAAELATIDWPAIRRKAIEALVDLMRTQPHPVRTESALDLCHHVDGVKKVYGTEARAIVAEAVGIIKAYVQELEKREARG